MSGIGKLEVSGLWEAERVMLDRIEMSTKVIERLEVIRQVVRGVITEPQAG